MFSLQSLHKNQVDRQIVRYSAIDGQKYSEIDGQKYGEIDGQKYSEIDGQKNIQIDCISLQGLCMYVCRYERNG